MTQPVPAGGPGGESALIRDALPADLEAIVAIYNATVASRLVTADLEPVSIEDRRAWFLAHQPQRRPLWVLEQVGPGVAARRVIGWLSLSDFYGRPAYETTAEVSIYVAESARGHGHGRRLLSRALEFAGEIGVRTLLGFIFGHNQPSLELFRALGFEVWGVLPRVARLDAHERDLVIVGRRLD